MFAPPGVMVMPPSVPIVAARSPAVPDAVEIMLPKFGTAPVVGADVGNASACRNDWLKLKASPGVFWVAAIVPGE